MHINFRLFACLALASQLSSVHAEPSKQIQGTWKLVQVIVPALGDSNPRGIPAVKEHYTTDGRLYFIAPEKRKDEKTTWANYRIDGNKRTVQLPNGKPHFAEVSFPDPSTLVVTQKRGDQWRYTRLQGDDAPNRKIEPISVEVLKMEDSSENIQLEYDTADYSGLPLEQRITGIWEVIAHRNVPRHEAPPYGFLNDIWTFDPSRVSLVSRAQPTESKPSKRAYVLKQGAIEIEEPGGGIRKLPVSFNSWGHMILDFAGHTMILKLIDKDSAKTAPRLPLRITLLSLRGEADGL